MAPTAIFVWLTVLSSSKLRVCERDVLVAAPALQPADAQRGEHEVAALHRAAQVGGRDEPRRVREAGGHMLDWTGRTTIHGGNAIGVNAALKDDVLKLISERGA